MLNRTESMLITPTILRGDESLTALRVEGRNPLLKDVMVKVATPPPPENPSKVSRRVRIIPDSSRFQYLKS